MELERELNANTVSVSSTSGEGFTEIIKITKDICPEQIFIVTSSRQFIVYSNYKEVWGQEKSMYSFEYIRNFDRNIADIVMKACEGEVIVRGRFESNEVETKL